MDFTYTIGHEKQKSLFEQIMQSGRLAHAYAFVGPEGVGKTTFAIDLAKIFGADHILDTFILDKEEGVSIEQARELQARLSLTPVGKYKVAIVTDAERMSQEAANSLLKTLEEPPGRSVLFLVTSNFYSLLPTIASRVQKISFGLTEDEDVSKALEGFDIEPAAKSEIVELASGRPGFAKRVAANLKLLDFFRESKKNYGVLKNGSAFERLLTSQRLAEAPTEDLEKFLKFAGFEIVQETQDIELSHKILRAFEDLRYNLNTKLVLDNLFL